MKRKHYIFYALAAIVLYVTLSCTDGNDWPVDSSTDRFFAPQIKSVDVGEESSDGTQSFDVTFNTNGGSSYIIEVNEDLFPESDTGDTLEGSVIAHVTFSPVNIPGLKSYTKYYVRMRALSDTKQPSKWSRYLDKVNEDSCHYYPVATETAGRQIFDPSATTCTLNSITVSWPSCPSDITPTKVMVYYVTDEGTTSAILHTLDESDVASKTTTIYGLHPDDDYDVYIYAGDICVGKLSTATEESVPDMSTALTIMLKDYHTICDSASWVNQNTPFTLTRGDFSATFNNEKVNKWTVKSSDYKFRSVPDESSVVLAGNVEMSYQGGTIDLEIPKKGRLYLYAYGGDRTLTFTQSTSSHSIDITKSQDANKCYGFYKVRLNKGKAVISTTGSYCIYGFVFVPNADIE